MKRILSFVIAVCMIWGYFNTATVLAVNTDDYMATPTGIFMPPNANTSHSISLLWDKPSDKMQHDRISSYRLHVVGENSGQSKTIDTESNKANYTITGLEPDTSYEVTVMAIDAQGAESDTSASYTVTTKSSGSVINITEAPYHALGDGVTVETEILQRAIDECPAGGTLLLPEGYDFLSGALFILRDDITIQVNGKLTGTMNPEDYLVTANRNPRALTGEILPIVDKEGVDNDLYGWPSISEGLLFDCFASLINIGQRDMVTADSSGEQLEVMKREVDTDGNMIVTRVPFEQGQPVSYDTKNIAIIGTGTIRGASSRPSRSSQNTLEYKEEHYRLDLMPKNNNIYMNAYGFAGDIERRRGSIIKTFNAENIYISGVDVKYPAFFTIHPVYSRNLTFNGLSIDSHGTHNGDGLDPESCENVYIYNCKFETGDDCLAIKSGKDKQGYIIGRPTTNVRVTDCNFKSGHGGMTIGSAISGGVNNVYVEDCEVTSSDLYAGLRFKTIEERGGIIEDITIKNIHMTQSGSKAAIRITSKYTSNPADSVAPTSAVFKNFTFENITVDRGKSNKPGVEIASHPYENIISNIVFKNVDIKGTSGVKARYVGNITFDNACDIEGSYSIQDCINISYPGKTALDSISGSGIIDKLWVNHDETWEINEQLQVGDKIYTDREHEITQIPTELQGEVCIRPATDSKHSTKKVLAGFTAVEDSWVYVMLDDRLSTPEWIYEENQSYPWLELDEQVIGVGKEESQLTYKVYRKRLAAGNLMKLYNQDQSSSTSQYFIAVVGINE